ncbi:unnamed protein product [Schistocephalus solidus]|uniref:Uncharacterized protein n=1 Tax=Schistocephalus solidus TaxID=70667 RepID=A0A183SI68_SCHSO|nr:unnamed protein product [Schistocephalus solidus]
MLLWPPLTGTQLSPVAPRSWVLPSGHTPGNRHDRRAKSASRVSQIAKYAVVKLKQTTIPPVSIPIIIPSRLLGFTRRMLLISLLDIHVSETLCHFDTPGTPCTRGNSPASSTINCLFNSVTITSIINTGTNSTVTNLPCGKTPAILLILNDLGALDLCLNWPSSLGIVMNIMDMLRKWVPWATPSKKILRDAPSVASAGAVVATVKAVDNAADGADDSSPLHRAVGLNTSAHSSAGQRPREGRGCV